MAEIYDINDTLITSIVTEVIPSPDVIEIEHRLLNGQYSLQTIGRPAKKINVTCFVNSQGKQTLDNFKGTATPIKVTADGKAHIGVIRGDMSPEHIKPNLYRLSFILLSEGDA